VLARDIQALALEQAMFVVLGRYLQPRAYRRAVRNSPKGPTLFTGVRIA